MAKDEKTSKRVAKLASDVLADRIKPTAAQIRTLAGAALTEAPDRPKPKPSKKK
jgi:hypothetical protein